MELCQMRQWTSKVTMIQNLHYWIPGKPYLITHSEAIDAIKVLKMWKVYKNYSAVFFKDWIWWHKKVFCNYQKDMRRFFDNNDKVLWAVVKKLFSFCGHDFDPQEWSFSLFPQYYTWRLYCCGITMLVYQFQ